VIFGNRYQGKTVGNQKVSLLALLVVPALLSACGGSDDDPFGPPPTSANSPEGLYGGTLTGAVMPNFEMLVLENGEFWSLYGQNTGGVFQVYGLVQGTGTSREGQFTSQNATVFYPPPVVPGTLTATFDASAKTITGTVNSNNTEIQFSGGPIAGSTYDYNTPASLSTLTGHWDAMSIDSAAVSVDIDSGGAITTLSNGCTASGTLTARPSGKNVFNVSLTFGPGPCVLPGQTVSGIALVSPLSSGQTQFIAAVIDDARTVGTAVFGVR
jgi:hypothetical protein